MADHRRIKAIVFFTIFTAYLFLSIPSFSMETARAAGVITSNQSTTAKGDVFARDLQVGSRGADVTALQKLLGITPTTGYFGELTKEAVIKYQLSKGITPTTGQVSEKTRASLEKDVAARANVTGPSPAAEGDISAEASQTGLPVKETVSFPAYQQQIFFPKTSQAVMVHTISGSDHGPTVLVFGGIHGDEQAGYMAADRFADVRIKNGRLILVPRLNAVAIKQRQRQGLGGDMNRLFDLPEKTRHSNPDSKVVDLAKSLIQQADYVINLHQAYDFYAPRWISRERNPSKWGQCNVIDTPTYHLHNGEKLELGRFANKVARRSNDRIKNKSYQFLVNNTNTGGPKTRHEEQKGSMTYYAMTKQHKIALAVEATKNCSLPEAIAFLTIAVNSALEEAGIHSDSMPTEDFLVIGREINKGKKKSKT